MYPARYLWYREAELRVVIAGQQSHRPKKRRTLTHEKRPQTVIDIQAKLAAGMGEGYRRWATVENLKRMARTKLYMDEHGFSYEDRLLSLLPKAPFLQALFHSVSGTRSSD